MWDILFVLIPVVLVLATILLLCRKLLYRTFVTKCKEETDSFDPESLSGERLWDGNINFHYDDLRHRVGFHDSGSYDMHLPCYKHNNSHLSSRISSQSPPPHYLPPQINIDHEVHNTNNNSNINLSPIQYINNPLILPRPGDNKNKGKWLSPVGGHGQCNGLGAISSSSCDTVDNNMTDNGIAYKANHQMQQQYQNDYQQEQQQLYGNNDEQVSPHVSTLSVEERARIHFKPTPIQYQQQEQLILQLQRRQQNKSNFYHNPNGPEQQQLNHQLSPVPLASSITSPNPSPLIFTPTSFNTGMRPTLDTPVDEGGVEFNDQKDNLSGINPMRRGSGCEGGGGGGLKASGPLFLLNLSARYSPALLRSSNDVADDEWRARHHNDHEGYRPRSESLPAPVSLCPSNKIDVPPAAFMASHIDDEKHSNNSIRTDIERSIDDASPGYQAALKAEAYSQRQGTDSNMSFDIERAKQNTPPKKDRPGAGVRTLGLSPSSSLMKLNLKDLSLERVLGGGAFGQVWGGVWRGTPVAVKVLSAVCQKNLPDSELTAFEDEVSMLARLRHPNICLYMGACLDPPNRAIVTELVSRGSLWEVLRTPNLFMGYPEVERSPSVPRGQGSFWPPWVVRRVLDDTCRGLTYLHSHSPPIIHRDLKSANLLLDDSFHVKICDFGLARLRDLNCTMTANVGTVQWMAPEVLLGQVYTESADMFSVAVVAWELFTGQCPYEGMNHLEVAIAVTQKGVRLQLPSKCTPMQIQLLNQCWSQKPSDRPTASQTLRELETAFPI